MYIELEKYNNLSLVTEFNNKIYGFSKKNDNS